MIPFVDLRAQYRSIKEEIDEAVASVLDGTQFVLGEQVEAFETEFAEHCRARYALGVNSGTSALHLALLAAGVKQGDEVITVSYTFVATVAAVHLQRAYGDPGYGAGDLPHTERASRETLSLPMYAELPREALSLAADSVRRFDEKAAGASLA